MIVFAASGEDSDDVPDVLGGGAASLRIRREREHGIFPTMSGHALERPGESRIRQEDGSLAVVLPADVSAVEPRNVRKTARKSGSRVGMIDAEHLACLASRFRTGFRSRRIRRCGFRKIPETSDVGIQVRIHSVKIPRGPVRFPYVRQPAKEMQQRVGRFSERQAGSVFPRVERTVEAFQRRDERSRR